MFARFRSGSPFGKIRQRTKFAKVCGGTMRFSKVLQEKIFQGSIGFLVRFDRIISRATRFDHVLQDAFLCARRCYQVL